MRPDLLSRRGPAGRSTTAWALRPAAAAAAFGKLAPDLLMAGSQLTLGITAGLARDSAPSNPGSGCRGDAMLPFEPTRPAHCPALPVLRRGVTAPPSTALTKGGESPSPRAWYGFGARWKFTPRPCPPGVATAPSIPGGKAIQTPLRKAADNRSSVTGRLRPNGLAPFLLPASERGVTSSGQQRRPGPRHRDPRLPLLRSSHRLGFAVSGLRRRSMETATASRWRATRLPTVLCRSHRAIGARAACRSAPPPCIHQQVVHAMVG